MAKPDWREVRNSAGRRFLFPLNEVEATKTAERRPAVEAYLRHHGVSVARIESFRKAAEERVCRESAELGYHSIAWEFFEFAVDANTWELAFKGKFPEWPWWSVAMRVPKGPEEPRSDTYRRWLADNAPKSAKPSGSSPASRGAAAAQAGGLSEAKPAVQAPERVLAKRSLQNSRDGYKDAVASDPHPKHKRPRVVTDRARGLDEGAAMSKAQGKKPMKPNMRPDISRLRTPTASSAVASANQDELEREATGIAMQNLGSVPSAERLTPPPLPSLDIRQSFWEQLHRTEDGGNGLVCGPFELQVPTQHDFVDLFYGDRGASLDRINSDMIDYRVKIAWTYDNDRASQSGEHPKKVVVGLDVENRDNPSTPMNESLRVALFTVWKQVEDWGERLLLNRPVPLIDLLSMAVSRQRAWHLKASDCKATPNEALAEKFIAARRKARKTAIRILTDHESEEDIRRHLTAWVMEPSKEDEQSQFGALDRIEVAELVWPAVLSPEKLWVAHDWADRCRRWASQLRDS